MEEVPQEIPEEMEEDQIQSLKSFHTHSSVVSRVHESILANTPSQETNKSNPNIDAFKDDSVFISTYFDPNDIKYKSKPHEVHFRITKFMKFLSIRLIFTIFGPLSILIFLLKYKGIVLVRNLGFIGFTWRTLWNYTYYTINALLLWGFFNVEWNYNMTLTFSHYICQIVTLIVVSSIKVAFFHPSKLDLMEQIPLAILSNSCEVCIDPVKWAMQPESQVAFEIDQSVKRMQVEPGQFVCFFMVKPNEKRRDKIQHKFEKILLAEEDKYAGNGSLMAQEVICNFNEQSSMTSYIIITALVSGVRLLLIIGLNVYFNFQYSAIGLVIYIAMLIIQTLVFAFIIMLMLVCFRDLQRKVYCMNQLSHLISAQKQEEYDDTKLFPTLNFLCVQSLFAWANLRKVFLDYGLQYSRRLTFIISYFILAVLVLIAFQIWLLFNPSDIEFDELFPLQTQIEYDISVILFMVIIIVLQGARINKHYKIHKDLIRRNLLVFQQIAVQNYFDKKYILRPKNFLYQILFKIIDDVKLNGKMKKNDFIQYTQFVIQSLESLYEDLNYEEEYQPFTVLGIAMTKKLAIQVGCSFAGVVATVGANTIFNMNI